jgi:hypothetical protein
MITRWRLSRVIVVFSIATTITIAGTSLVRSAADEKRPADSVAALVRRIEALENRVETLEKLPRYVQIPGGTKVPPNWGSSEINGQTFYVVPLTTKAARPATATTTDTDSRSGAVILPQPTGASR